MLGVGWTEMMLIGVVALVVIGPKELPVVMNRIGKFAATIRRMGSDFQRELNKTTGLDEIRNLRQAVTEPLKATTDAIRKEFNSVSSTGVVTPSGVIKPADPKAESVVAEIKAAAGLTPAAPANPAVADPSPLAVTEPATPIVTEPAAPAEAAATAPEVVVEPVKAPKPKRVAKAKPVTAEGEAVVEAVAKTPAPRRRKKTIESPAPVEAIAPAEPAAKPKRKSPAKRPPVGSA